MFKFVETRYWPKGVERAVTLSYDDGRAEDYRLVEMLNKYGIKSSFHLNVHNELEKLVNGAPLVKEKDYATLYVGHEISCHMVHHPFPVWQPDEAIRAEVYENRRYLENMCHYPVRGLSYPYANFNQRVIDVCRACGMEYGRTVAETGSFAVPEDFMRWNPTCHHSGATKELVDRFMAPLTFDLQRLMYVWGHSYEFYTEEHWQKMEEFCKYVTSQDGIWYATNIEIYDYVMAQRALRFSEGCTCVYNPTCTDVWIGVDYVPVKVGAGETVQL